MGEPVTDWVSEPLLILEYEAIYFKTLVIVQMNIMNRPNLKNKQWTIVQQGVQ